MTVTATQLKKNLGYYLELADNEAIYITKNGKAIATLTNPTALRMNALNSLIGILPDISDDEIDAIRMERLSRQL